jgi:hypothetical protein
MSHNPKSVAARMGLTIRDGKPSGVARWLRRHGYTGLYCDLGGDDCGCGFNDEVMCFHWCGENGSFTECQPAYWHPKGCKCKACLNDPVFPDGCCVRLIPPEAAE